MSESKLSLEMEILEAILGENVIITSPETLTVHIHPEIDAPLTIKQANTNTTKTLKFLPPAKIKIKFPRMVEWPEYRLKCTPPEITVITHFYKPLSQTTINTILTSIFNPDECCIFELYNEIKEILDAMETSDLDLNYMSEFENYNHAEEQNNFDKNIFECLFCYEEMFGCKMVRCETKQHAYCKNCLKKSFDVGFEDTSLMSFTKSDLVKCPYSESDEVNGIVSHGILNLIQMQNPKILPTQTFEKYNDFLLNKTLTKLSPVNVICPTCINTIYLETAQHEIRCPYCDIYFCSDCSKSAHSPLTCEDVKTKKQKLQELIAAEISDLEKQRNNQDKFRVDTWLCKQLIDRMTELRWPGIDVETEIKKMFGNGFVKRIMDDKTLKEIKNNCFACPKCNEPIEKNGGCNHMRCRCGHDFQFKGDGLEVKDLDQSSKTVKKKK